MQLVSMLVDPLPDDLKQHMTLLFSKLARLSPSFATFRAAAKSCMLLEQLSTKDPLRVRCDEQLHPMHHIACYDGTLAALMKGIILL